jgi:hypothetical protein
MLQNTLITKPGCANEAEIRPLGDVAEQYELASLFQTVLCLNLLFVSTF